MTVKSYAYLLTATRPPVVNIISLPLFRFNEKTQL